MGIGMKKMIYGINSREDLLKLNSAQLSVLAKEMREYIIDTVSQTGGHLASNLGTVELTIALHRVLRLPKDKLIWDVGHQSYTHKILSGRRDELDKLRQMGGISGFCDPEESSYDFYTSGHSSTSLSLALGAACARDMLGKKYNVAAVIGDGAMTGGLALEALNNIGNEKRKVLIVLNDNEMSISQNVGAISSYLTRARTSVGYTRSKRGIDSALEKLPNGERIASVMRKMKDNLKYFVSPGVLFEEMGVTYLGPVDGHNIRQMEDTFRRALKLNEPVLVHVLTKKGLGYKFAEEEPQKYHGVGPFDKNKGVSESTKETYSSVFGSVMCDLAEKNDRVAVITPAMTLGSGLSEFEKKYPERFYDVGIAEAHAVTFAAGLAGAGITPVVSLYSSFAQRSYDSIVHDVAAGSLHVVFALDRAGLVPGDGKTHQGTMDIAFLSSIPNMTVLSPCSFDELEKMLYYAVEECKGPVAVRYPRGGAELDIDMGDFEIGKASIVKEGAMLTILSEGTETLEAIKAAEILSEKGIDAEVINARTIKPLDTACIINSVKKTGRLVTLEQGVRLGGLGEAAFSAIAQSDISCKCMSFALDDFVTHGSLEDLLDHYELCGGSVADKIEKEWFGEKKA